MRLQQEKGEVCEAEEPSHRIIIKTVTQKCILLAINPDGLNKYRYILGNQKKKVKSQDLPKFQ